MATIMISILPDGSIPVDKINRGENGEPSCPIATKDADINAENKEEAILSANYGEAYRDRKSTRLNSSHSQQSRMPSPA